MATPIAIDTNIFIHLTNPQDNPDSHIDQLLIHLTKSEPRLYVDSTKKIANEYLEKLGPRIIGSDDKGIVIYLLRFWMNQQLRDEIETDTTDALMRSIREVIYEPAEHADRAFVYVSCKGNCCLITNDVAHIWGRKAELKHRTKKMRGPNSVILKSTEAVESLVKKQ